MCGCVCECVLSMHNKSYKAFVSGETTSWHIEPKSRLAPNSFGSKLINFCITYHRHDENI